MPKHYVYVLNCRDRYLYTGYTTDLQRRLFQHQNGTASKFTRSHLPVKLAYHETFSSKSRALKREVAIKKLSRRRKLLLISGKKYQTNVGISWELKPSMTITSEIAEVVAIPFNRLLENLSRDGEMKSLGKDHQVVRS